MKKRKNFFTKTTLQHSFYQRLSHNCFLDTRFVSLSHNNHDNSHWEHNVFSDNVRTRPFGVCTELDLDPTHVWVIHEGIFLIWVLPWSIGIPTPFWLCFWCRGSFARQRMTKCTLVFRAVANPNNSTNKTNIFFTKMLWPHSSGRGHSNNCVLDTHVVSNDHKSFYSIRRWYSVFSYNGCTLPSRVCIWWDPDPTLVWLVHRLLFPFGASTCLTDFLVPLRLWF